MSTWSAARSERARRRLIDAAGDVIAERGWPSASVHYIGERAALSRGAVNYHFGTREQLLEAVLADLVERWRLEWEDGEASAAGSRPAATLGAALDHYWAVVAGDPRGARLATMLLYESLGPSPQITDEARRARRSLIGAVEAQLRELQASGAVKADADCRAAASLLVGSTAGLAADAGLGPAAAAGYAELRAALLARFAA